MAAGRNPFLNTFGLKFGSRFNRLNQVTISGAHEIFSGVSSLASNWGLFINRLVAEPAEIVQDVDGRGVYAVVREAAPVSPGFEKGDLFLAVASGRYQRRTADGRLIEVLDDGSIGVALTTGCALDADGNLYTTNFVQNRVVRYARAHPHAITLDLRTRGTVRPTDEGNESIVFDAAGNFYVGHAGSPVSFGRGGKSIHKYSPDGALLAEYEVETGPVSEHERGSDWIDLAADQCTMFYTSEGVRIRRYDVCSSTQLPDFVRLPEGSRLFAFRILPPGDASAHLLVADAGAGNIKRLDASGTVIQTYDADGEDSWFSLNLDPNGRSFWSGDNVTNNFYRFNIESGAVEIGPLNTDLPGSFFGGICVAGEITAARGEQQCANGVDDDGDGKIDCEDPDCAGTPECPTNRPPQIVCVHPGVTNDPGLCSTAVACESIASCSDPDGDPITLSCVPRPPYPVGTPEVTVECSDGQVTETASCTVRVDDVEPPAGRITWPQPGSCHSIPPVVVGDDFADNCDTPLQRTYEPAGGPSYSGHGSHHVILTVTDASANTASDSVDFVIDTIAPDVQILQPPPGFRLPGDIPFDVLFDAADDDGAEGSVVHETITLDGCLIFDGDTYGNGDGLLSDEVLHVTLPELCRLTAICGFTELIDPTIIVEATDCAGTTGSDSRQGRGSARLRPGLCD